MATEVAERLMSAEEFLEWECAQQPYRNELIDNRIITPCQVASQTHTRSYQLEPCTRQLEVLLCAHGQSRCDVYAGIAIGVMVDAGSRTYTYPDVTVVCDEPEIPRRRSTNFGPVGESHPAV